MRSDSDHSAVQSPRAAEESASLAEVRIGERRIERWLRSQRVRGDVGEDAGCDVGDVLESHSLEVDPGLLLQPVHHRVPEAPLVPEVAVDRALVDACLLGDAADRERAPVPDGGAVGATGIPPRRCVHGSRRPVGGAAGCRIGAAAGVVRAVGMSRIALSDECRKRLPAPNGRRRGQPGVLEVDVPLGKAGQHLVEGDAPLHAGESGAHAQVDAVAERQMPTVVPVDVEACPRRESDGRPGWRSR